MGQLHDDIKTLRKAGKFAEVKDILTKAADDRGLESIRRNDQLSEAGKLRQIAIGYQSRRQNLEAQLRKMAATVIVDDRDDAARVFGTQGLPGDPASLTISRRDAGDRVASIESKAELQALLRRATRGNDEILARACVERAVELKYPDVVNEFSAARPKLEAAVDRLWYSEQAEHDTFEVGVYLANLRPSELQGSSEWAIEQLAQPETPAPANPHEFKAGGLFLDPPAGFVTGDYSGEHSSSNAN